MRRRRHRWRPRAGTPSGWPVSAVPVRTTAIWCPCMSNRLRPRTMARLAEVETAVGDALAVDLADASVDAVLLLGPLYHLPRARLSDAGPGEARRVVRSGGLVFVAGDLTLGCSRSTGSSPTSSTGVCAGIIDELPDVERTGVLRPLFPGSFNGYSHRQLSRCPPRSATPASTSLILSASKAHPRCSPTSPIDSIYPS